MRVSPELFDVEPLNWRSRLDASVEVMKELSRFSDPQEMSAVFIRRMAQLFPFDRQLTVSRRGLSFPRYRVMQFNHRREFAAAKADPQPRPVHEGGLLADLVYSEQPQLIAELNLRPGDPAEPYLAGQRSVVALPYFEQGTTQNVVVLSHEEPDAFPREQMADLVLFSNLFGRTTQSLVLSRAVREAYEAVDSELRTLADIQKSLLPLGTPRLPGLDVAVHYQTAKRVGGDYYDFFPLSEDRLGVLVADASGHGAPAAVLMAIAHSITHAKPEPFEGPRELLTRLNSHLSGRYTQQSGSFMTAFAAVLDLHHGTLTYASAGHHPPRLRRAVDATLVSLNRSQRLPLGVKADESYPEQTLPLNPGDCLVIFTDGVIETGNPSGEMFGTDRIDAALSQYPVTAERLIERILTDLSRFSAGLPVADDRTLLVLRRE